MTSGAWHSFSMLKISWLTDEAKMNVSFLFLLTTSPRFLTSTLNTGGLSTRSVEQIRSSRSVTFARPSVICFCSDAACAPGDLGGTGASCSESSTVVIHSPLLSPLFLYPTDH